MAYQTINPNNEELIKSFPEHTDGQLEQIIAQAESTYKNDWSRKTPAERKAIVKKAASILREKRDEFAKPITLEMGKLFREAQGEVDLSADILDYYADNAEKFLAPEKLKVDEGEAYVESAPLGVIFCVEPWNFPYYQLARVAGPNLMVGNTLIVKHAPNVPQCALAFEELFLDAGAPVGAYTNVFISNEQSAVAIADKRIKEWPSPAANGLEQQSRPRQARPLRRAPWNWAAVMLSLCSTMRIWTPLLSGASGDA